MSDAYPLSELGRRLHNLVGLGTIAEADHAGGRLRAAIAGRLTGWLPVPALIGRNFRAWIPVRVGAQVAVAAPSGDPANGVVAATLYKADQPPPDTSPDHDVIAFDDGTRLTYDSAAHRLDLAVTGGGELRLSVGGTVLSITAEGVTITGPFDVAGSIHASGSILDEGGNTAHHGH